AKWTFPSGRGTWPLRKPGSRACFCTRSYARSHSLVTTSAGASTTRRRLQLSISSTATFIEASSGGARGGSRTPKGDPPTGSYVQRVCQLRHSRIDVGFTLITIPRQSPPPQEGPRLVDSPHFPRPLTAPLRPHLREVRRSRT